jgi:dipeptidase E
MITIVAIGGGDIRTESTAIIDKEIIRLSGKKKPKLLFIPTASSDDEVYWRHIEKYFGGHWGCDTDVLYLIKENPSPEEIKEKIAWADIVYVGGGNTLKMMRLWRRLGVDRLLEAAGNRGAILCGVSAGSICWFEFGHSDSMSSYNPDNWQYIKVRGLGLIKGVHCPHYDNATLDVPRKKHFQNMIQKVGGRGIAIDDNCALIFSGGDVRVLASQLGAGAYMVHKKDGKIIETQIKPQNRALPLNGLYE